MVDISRLSILIVTWKRDDLLRDCLDSIVRVTDGHVPRTVIVDNANWQTTRELCAAYSFVAYCAAEENLGFAGGNNLGLPLCPTDYILLLNNDTVLEEEPFSALLSYAEDHPEVGVVGGKLWMGPEWPEGTLNGTGNFLTKWGVLYSPAFLVKDADEFCHPQKVFSASGALMLVKRSAIERGGGLFYSHFKSYYEEVDFCHRVWLSGLEVHFIPTPKVLHLTGKTTGMMSYANILKQYYRNIFFSHATTLSLLGMFRVALPFLCLYFGSFALRLVRGNFKQAGQMLDVFQILWRERGLIRQTRAHVQAIRKRTDREIFREVMWPLPFDYFLKAMKAQ